MNPTRFSNSLTSQGSSWWQTSIQHTQPMSMPSYQLTPQMIQPSDHFANHVTSVQQTDNMSMQPLPSYQLSVQTNQLGYISTSSTTSPHSGQAGDVVSASQTIHSFNQQQHGGNFDYNMQPMFLTSQTNSSTLPNHLLNNFFYQPPDDLFNYHIKCEKISLQLLNNNSMQLKENEHIFYYQRQSNNQLYQITCKIVSPNYLNEMIYGVEIVGQKKFAFISNQKENLQIYLTQYLSHHLLSN